MFYNILNTHEDCDFDKYVSEFFEKLVLFWCNVCMENGHLSQDVSFTIQGV